MEINNYIGKIVIPTDEPNIVNKFLEKKGDEIQKEILRLWEEFSINAKLHIVDDIVVKPINDKPIELNESLSNDEIVINNDEVEDLVYKPETVSENESENPFITIKPISESNSATTNNLDPIITEKNSATTNNPDPIVIEKKDEVVTNAQLEILLKNMNLKLPNGKVNQEYNYLFNAEQIGIPVIGEIWLDGFENLGLKYDSKSGIISGIPLLAGEHIIKLVIRRKGWTEGNLYYSRNIMLVVNPDPKTLWKDIPTSTDIEYYKQDFEKEFVKVKTKGSILGFGTVTRKDMIAASQRGRSHAHDGRARDDDFGLYYSKENDWYIMTVADGAGGSKFSRKGSEIACKTVVEVCKTQLEIKHKEFENLIKEFNKTNTDEKRKKMGDVLYKIVGTSVFDSLKKIKDEALKANNPVKDYSTTLIVSICKKFQFGWFVGAFWVGDGGIGIYNKDTKFLKVLGESDGGEFAGQTRFLTMPEITEPVEIYRRLRFEIVEDFTALILMTDGITDAKFETDANLIKIEKWDELWNDLSKDVDFSDDNLNSADQLLKWLDFWSPGNHDDRTIAILF